MPEAGSGPGLLIEQEIFGVNASLRAVADLYAEEGYVCLVPDLFWRMEPGVDLGYDEDDFAKAFDFYQRFDVDQALVDIGAALDALRARPECTGKAAAMGFCLGGKLAYLTATRHDVDAAVSFYGVGIEDALDESGGIACPVLMHFAGEDSFVPQDAVNAISTHFEARPEVRIHVYPGVDHAFYNHARSEVYHRPSAMVAHSRTIALLRRALGPTYDLEIALGASPPPRIHGAQHGRDHGHHGGRALRQPHPDHDRRHRRGRAQPLLRRTLHPRRCLRTRR